MKVVALIDAGAWVMHASGGHKQRELMWHFNFLDLL